MTTRVSMVGAAASLFLLANSCRLINTNNNNNNNASIDPASRSMVVGQAIQFQVHDGQQPVVGMRITVRTADREDEFNSGVLWQGMTDHNSHAEGLLSLRTDQHEVQVIAQRAGYRGPYSDPSLLAVHGYFAPSVWLLVPTSQLPTMDISVTRNAQ
jgi:hypothetical protein